MITIEHIVPNLSREDLLGLLRFASGISNSIPQSALNHHQEAVDFLKHHRVVGRAEKNCRACGIAPTQPIVLALAKEQDAIVIQHQHNEKIFKEFLSVFCSDMKVVVLKGQSSFYRTGRIETLRASVDIDIAVSAPTTLRSRLAEANLLEAAVNARLAAHEFGSARYFGLEFDLHKYIPTWFRSSQPTIWKGKQDGCTTDDIIVERRITLDDIKRMGQIVDVGGNKVIVAGPTIAALISLVSSYRDYIMHIGSHLQNRPACRLCEVCEVLDCLNSPEFDEQEFVAAIKFFNAEEALEWFGSVFNNILFDNRLLHMLQAITGRQESVTNNYRVVGAALWMPFKANPIRDLLSSPNTADLFELNTPATYRLSDGETIKLNFAEGDGKLIAATYTVGGPSMDEREIKISRHNNLLEVSFNLGAEITDIGGAYFECDGEMCQWENLGNFKSMHRFAITSEATKRIQDFRWTDNCHVNFKYGLEPTQLGVDIVLGAQIPQLPWNAFLAWLSFIRLEFN